MSQNKTRIQGLDPGEPNPRIQQPSEPYGFYSRGAAAPHKGTVVPGMGQQSQTTAPVGYYPPQYPQQPLPQASQQPTGKPVVGFLYSVSRTAVGEYWPLVMGRNSIGQTANSDVRLLEGTVSAQHAVLVTRRVKGTLIAAITDAQSTGGGTMINDEVIGFTPETVKDGDTITIGNNYKFVVCLIDTNLLGLCVSPNFVDVSPEEEEEDMVDVTKSKYPGDNATNPGGFDPHTSSWNGGRANDGTVGLDGSLSGGTTGGTVPM